MSHLFLLMEEATSNTDNQGGGWITIVILVALMAALFIPSVISSKKNKKEVEKTMASLSVGTMLTTYGGIKGKIVELDGDDMIIETGSEEHKTYLRLTKYAIRSIDNPQQVAQEEVVTNEIK